jgi:hypothetical protein
LCAKRPIAKNFSWSVIGALSAEGQKRRADLDASLQKKRPGEPGRRYKKLARD